MQSTEPEAWKPVVGYEGLYEVSDLGRIRSLDRLNSRGRRSAGKVLSPGKRASGHLGVVLRRGGSPKAYLAHRLVLAAFIGPCPEGMEGCHNNGIPSDNRVANLRWDTRISNMHDRVRHHGRYHPSDRCKRGHLLEGKNLLSSKRGSRRCRACARASAHSRFHGKEIDSEYANRAYLAIMHEA